MIITLEHYFLWFLFYSFVGWMYESILVSCQQHRLVNRGFLNGPLCPIYGTGAILGVAILGNVHNPIIIFREAIAPLISRFVFPEIVVPDALPPVTLFIVDDDWAIVT